MRTLTHAHAFIALKNPINSPDHITINKIGPQGGLKQNTGRELILTSGLRRRKQGWSFSVMNSKIWEERRGNMCVVRGLCKYETCVCVWGGCLVYTVNMSARVLFVVWTLVVSSSAVTVAVHTAAATRCWEELFQAALAKGLDIDFAHCFVCVLTFFEKLEILYREVKSLKDGDSQQSSITPTLTVCVCVCVY